MLNCSCSHNRLNHVGGDLISDRRVLKCETANCTCSKYNPSNDNDDSYIYKSVAITIIFFAVATGMFFGIGAGIDMYLGMYEIDDLNTEPETFLTYANGTRVDTISGGDFDSSPREQLSYYLKMIVFLALYISFAILGILFISPVFDADKRKAINSK